MKNKGFAIFSQEYLGDNMIEEREIKIKHILGLLPKKNRIAFESNPDMADNTYPVYKEMLARGLNKKYEFIWFVRHPERFEKDAPENVRFENLIPGTRLGYYRKHIILARAKCLISCNTYFRKYSKRQLTIYLTHGSGIKSVKRLYGDGIKNNCDWFLSQAYEMDSLNLNELGIPINRQAHLGFPRNDVLFSGSKAIDCFVNRNEIEKVVLWLPTYRQMVSGGYSDTGNCLPILHEISDFRFVNEYLKSKHILLLIKLHPVQAKNLSLDDLSNIKLIDDDELQNRNVQLYEILAGCDALITDYSSVYFDYLLTDKPIGLTQDDLEEYKKKRGFLLNYDEWLKGWPINSVKEMIEFLESVKNGTDPYIDERVKSKRASNLYQDANSTKRVVDFIIEKAEL